MMNGSEGNVSSSSSNKRFSKKQFLQEKYNKKLKIQRWQEQRKTAVLRKYRKELKHMNVPCHNVDQNEEYSGNTDGFSNPLQKAKMKYERLREERRKQKEDMRNKKNMIRQALDKYNKNKREKYKKLSKRTRTGQPIMKDRLELLLQKIESSTPSLRKP